MLKSAITHGFFPNAVASDNVEGLKEKINDYLASQCFPEYSDGLDKKIPAVIDLIPEYVHSQIKEILRSESITLENVELHYLPPFSTPIPPHQDNFYHCIEGGEGLKLLIPFTEFSPENGGLFFLDCPSEIGVLHHSPSRVNNFSCYIVPEILQRLDYPIIAYSYRPGDASYHLLNSIHFSNGNRSKSAALFLVYRYHAKWVSQSPALLKHYQSTFKAHIEQLEG